MSLKKEQGKKRKIVVSDRDFQFRYLMTWALLTTLLLAGLALTSLCVLLVFGGSQACLIWANVACAVAMSAGGRWLW